MRADDISEEVPRDSEIRPPAAPDAQGVVPRLVGVQEDAAGGVTTYTFSYTPKPVLFQFRHLVQERLFAVTAVDGEAQPQYFRDNPTRFLVVEPYTLEGGEAFMPVVERGRPVYLWLCREEREAR